MSQASEEIDIQKCGLNANNCDQFSFNQYRQNSSKSNDSELVKEFEIKAIEELRVATKAVEVGDAQTQENGNHLKITRLFECYAF